MDVVKHDPERITGGGFLFVVILHDVDPILLEMPLPFLDFIVVLAMNDDSTPGRKIPRDRNKGVDVQHVFHEKGTVRLFQVVQHQGKHLEA